jgi:hopene-associated glycosyltransferase HpnB
LIAIMTVLAALSALIWLSILLLPWQPWRNTDVLRVREEPAGDDLSDVTVVIPARNEAAMVGESLGALVQSEQGTGLRVVLLDDGSVDGTADAARSVPGLDLEVVPGRPLPEGWAGKVWALQQGVVRVETPLTLMIDADIALGRGVVAALKAQMEEGRYQFVSVMATLTMHSFWERLLCPSFIYFFKLLYPFRLARTRNPRFYSAAGGCILIQTRVLQAIGGLASIRDALIDDCALARQVKRGGFGTWIGQSRAVNSIRPYTSLGDIWNMVARSAFTQLRYSVPILLLTSFFLVTLFFVPLATWLVPSVMVRVLGLLAWGLMMASYLPTLLFYSLSPLWALLMPVTGGLYLGMTWSSALRYWRGKKSTWKGRVYRSTRS